LGGSARVTVADSPASAANASPVLGGKDKPAEAA
jgi:hypothetical protein